MPDLFTPLRIGQLTLKNRFMMSPMENGMGHMNGTVSDRLIRFFHDRAARGVALIMTGSVAVSPEGVGQPTQLRLDGAEHQQGLAALCAAVHAAGGAIGAQIYHAGGQASEAITGLEPLAPSARPCPLLNNRPRAMTVADMDRVTADFVRGAQRAVEAGFDLVEVHFAHGYLLHGFLSPHSNRRTDEWGGSLANRCRFPFRVLEAVMAAVGERVPVTIRLSVDEFLDDGLGFDEARLICRQAEQAGCKAVSVSAGSYDSLTSVIQPLFVPRGFLLPFAETLKLERGIPIIVAGRLNNAALLDDIITSGKADMVAVGRGFFADEDLVQKLREGRHDDIRYCVACNQGCTDRLFTGESIHCMLNPRTAFEGERDLQPATTARRVAVVGGGPAGLEAARVAALRGHEVTLFEARETLGGKLDLVATPPEKADFALFREYLIRQVQQAGVRVIRQTVISPADLEPGAFDEVILATGASPVKPPIPGIDLPHVVLAEAVLANTARVGNRVVIIGGGLVGLETAHFLAVERPRAITVLELLDSVARDCGPTFRGHLERVMRRHGVIIRTGAAIERIEAAGVYTGHGHEPADTVVVATGSRPDAALAGALRTGFPQLHVIGDAAAPRTILQAVHEAWLCAMAI